jgi:hypothetical protein
MAKELKSTDYVILNEQGKMVRGYHSNEVIIYGDYGKARADLLNAYETIYPCTELPKEMQDILLEQINQE